MNSSTVQHNTPSPVSQYKVTNISNLGSTCASCSLFQSGNSDDILVMVIPAIEDEELFNHLEEYTESTNNWSMSNLEDEIERYLTERKEQEKLRLNSIQSSKEADNKICLFTDDDLEELTPELQAYMDSRIAANKSLLPGSIGLM